MERSGISPRGMGAPDGGSDMDCLYWRSQSVLEAGGSVEGSERLQNAWQDRGFDGFWCPRNLTAGICWRAKDFRR